MRTVLITTLALTSTILSASAIHLAPRRDGEAPKVVQHQIRRKHVADPIQHDRDRLRRRQSGTVTVKLSNEQTLYFMTVDVGTPPQQVQLHIDTGSSDLWVNSESSSLCGTSSMVCAGFQPYPNVPVNMVQSGYINTNAYSLWLDDLDASTGQIVFGGVNTDKYQGELQTLPIIKQDNQVYGEFIIGLTDIGQNGNKGSLASQQAIGALLDSGSSLMYLPDPIAEKIYAQFNANYDAANGVAIVDCSLQQSTETVDFTFSTPTISVPLSELVIVGGQQDGQPLCIIGIGKAGNGMSVLGDTFIRSAYIVYDISNNEISLAQTDFSSTTDNVVEIGTGKNAIPSATMVQNAITSVVQASDGAVLGGFSASGSANAAKATAPVGYNMALLGAAAGAAMMAL